MADTRIALNPTDLARLALMSETSVTEADRPEIVRLQSMYGATEPHVAAKCAELLGVLDA